MLKSMTGFGRFEVSQGDRKVSVEIKSVNHRYLELGIKLPKKLNFLESDIRNELKKYVERGKVDVFITYENLGTGNECVRYNPILAREYFDCYSRISEQLGIDNDVKASHIMRSPDVVTIESEEDDEEVITSLVIQAIDGAAQRLVKTRHSEGERLKDDLLNKLDGMITNVEFITQKSPIIVSEYKEKITTKIRELLEDTQVDEARIVQEVTIFADKVSVDEELVRLDSHIKAMKEALLKGGTIGRRLDFIAQEMNREANTTLSKTTDSEISDRAIELKTDIEKVREQIQNIE
ncbi:MAG: YicC/YloC family endoribonuclease [Eubacterium sp.]